MIGSTCAQTLTWLWQHTTGPVSFCLNAAGLALVWLFLPLESTKWQWVRAHRAALFPQVNFEALKPLDPLRLLIQGLFLLFVSPRALLGEGRDPSTQLTHTWRHRLRKGFEHFWTPLIKAAQRWVNAVVHRIEARAGEPHALPQRLGLLARVTLYVLALAAATLAWLCITQPLSVANQSIFLLASLILAYFFREIRTHLTLIFMILLSSIISARYLWWRWTETLNDDTTLGLICSLLLVLAETYAFVVMILAYFQVVWVLDRKPVPMPSDMRTWPTVDLLIPTYNEPLDVVKPTVLGAQSLDWPQEKLRISLLDDGSRPEFERFAKAVGINYITRKTHEHAKAGNINHALKQLHGDLVAIFDCDHIPVRGFLQMTVGWMIKDPQIALVQTPHHFYSQDPFERNLGLTSTTPVENALFHNFIQKGNDAWNATMFCGSCAVMRRSALDEVGWIAVETVTEDAHTSLKLNRRGWKSAFIGIPLAAGLSTETLSAHVGQRIRWARGMVQIFRLDNPLVGKGLKLAQRLCFLNAMIHFLHGLPRIIFLLAPLPYLLFDTYVIKATAVSILVYVLPHMLLATLTTSVLHRGHRSPFLGGVYETILSWYILIPTTVALVAPKVGKFNVTVKGGTVRQSFLDWQIARPYLTLIALNLAGFVWAGWTALKDPFPDLLTIGINVGWILYNLVLLGATMAVAVEVVQERRFPRVKVERPATLECADGTLLSVDLQDFSQKGASIRLPDGNPITFTVGAHAALILEDNGLMHRFPIIVRRASPKGLGLEFETLTLDDERQLVAMTFCRNDVWCHDKPKPTGLVEGTTSLLLMAVRGYRSLWRFMPQPLTRLMDTLATPLGWVFSFVPRLVRWDKGRLDVGRRTTGTPVKP